MRRLLDILRAICISPEMLWILIIVSGGIFFPSLFSAIGHKLQTNTDIWKFLPTLPILFAGAAINASGKLRSPSESNKNKELYNWEDYHRVTDRVYIGLTMALISAASAIALWMFADQMPAALVATVFLCSTGVSGYVAYSFIISSHKVRELLEKNI